MNPCNAIIKDWTLKKSECYSSCLELVLTLDLQGGGGCCFRVTGVYEKKWTKNQFGYAVKRVLEITEADRLEDIKGKPVRAKFTGNGSLGDTLSGSGHLLRENWLIPREDSMWNDEIKDDEEE